MKIPVKTLVPFVFIFLSAFMVIPGSHVSNQIDYTVLPQTLTKTTTYTPQFSVYNVKEQMTLSPIFTPDNALDTYLYWIGRSNKSIYIQNPYITKFTSTTWPDASPIVKALVTKFNQGVTDIKIQINQDADHDNVTSYLQGANIPVRWMGNYTSANGASYLSTDHNKLMIIDNKVVILSSINFGENAFLNNRESGMVIQDVNVANYCNKVFEADWAVGEIPPFPMFQAQKVQSFNKITSPEVATYQSPTNIPKANFTGVYNVSVFTNPDNADNFIFHYLQSAKKSIYVSMYTISRPDFNNTLIALKKANPALDIRVLISWHRVDTPENTATYEAAQSLVDNLIPVYNSTMDLNYYHNKYWIIDGNTTFVYSGNWSPRSVTPKSTTPYGSGDANRDMGIAVFNAPDVASFFTNQVWKKDVAAGSAWTLSAGVKQLSFKAGDVVSGTVNLRGAVSNLNNTKVYYTWNNNAYTEVNTTNDIFSKAFDTTTLTNGVNTFTVKAVTDINQVFTDSVNVTVANYPKNNNWRVLITEVLANPSATTDALGEYYQITNSFPFVVSLDGWSTGTKDSSFNFPSGYVIPAYTSIILARDATGFKNAYKKDADFSYSFSLVNTADYVYLKNNNGNYVDVVAYGMSAPDGSATLTAAPSGKSLQRSPMYIDTNTTADFITASPNPKVQVPQEPLLSSGESYTNASSSSSTTAPGFTVELVLAPILLASVIFLKRRVLK